MEWSKKAAMEEPDNSLGGLTMALDGLRHQAKNIRNEAARQEIEPLVSQAIFSIAAILNKYHDQGVGFGTPHQVEQLRGTRKKWLDRNMQPPAVV